MSSNKEEEEILLRLLAGTLLLLFNISRLKQGGSKEEQCMEG